MSVIVYMHIHIHTHSFISGQIHANVDYDFCMMSFGISETFPTF